LVEVVSSAVVQRRCSLTMAPLALAATGLATEAFVPSGLPATAGVRSAPLSGMQSFSQGKVDGNSGSSGSLFSSIGLACAMGGALAGVANTRATKKKNRLLVPFVMRKAGMATESLAPSEQVGNTAPLGFFDPLGFSTGQTISYPDDLNGFKFLRSAELKNGRVAMMASVGLVVQHYVKLPGFEDVPAGLGALSTSAGALGFAALVSVVGLIEAAEYANGTFRSSMGNYGDPLSLGQYNEEYQNKELNNCRMAMFAVLGQLVAEMVTGKDAIEQLGI